MSRSLLNTRFVYLVLLFVLLSIAIISCKKDSKTPVLPSLPGPPVYPFVCEDTTLDWTPYTFDTDFGQIVQYYGKLGVWRTQYDPRNSNIIYYMTFEESGQNHHLWKYDRLSKVKTHLTENVLNEFAVSNTGWIAFEKVHEIYKIKTNGDSLSKVSFNSGGYPTWSEDGNFIYYIHSPTGHVYKYSQLTSSVIDTIKNVYSPIVQFKNFYFYGTFNQATNKNSIVRKNILDNTITTIVERTTPYDPNGENIIWFFLDKQGTNLFWYGEHGLSVTNLQSLQTKRVINSGRGSRSFFFYYNRCPENGQIIGTCNNDSVISSLLLYRKNLVWEYSADGKCRRMVELPN